MESWNKLGNSEKSSRTTVWGSRCFREANTVAHSMANLDSKCRSIFTVAASLPRQVWVAPKMDQNYLPTFRIRSKKIVTILIMVNSSNLVLVPFLKAHNVKEEYSSFIYTSRFSLTYFWIAISLESCIDQILKCKVWPS